MAILGGCLPPSPIEKALGAFAAVYAKVAEPIEMLFGAD